MIHWIKLNSDLIINCDQATTIQQSNNTISFYMSDGQVHTVISDSKEKSEALFKSMISSLVTKF